MSTTPPPGFPASPTPPTPPAPAPFPSPPRREEKEDEKEDEKRGEKDEKSQEEKWRRDPLSAIVWACILIWAGVVLLLGNLNYLPRIPGLPMNEWSLIFLGAGIIILLEVVIRLVMPEHRRGIVSSLIVAIVFIGIGGGGSIGWGFLWGFGLIALGVVVLVGGFRGRR
jgi:hypothetical protein